MDKYRRYRLKDLDGYRAKKRALTKTPAHREVRRLYMQKWRAANREKHNASARLSHARHREARNAVARARHYLVKYGLSAEAALAMKRAGCGLCARTTPPLHIDHDHATGIVRGVLCVKCNTALGWYEKFSTQIESYLRG